MDSFLPNLWMFVFLKCFIIQRTNKCLEIVACELKERKPAEIPAVVAASAFCDVGRTAELCSRHLQRCLERVYFSN